MPKAKKSIVVVNVNDLEIAVEFNLHAVVDSHLISHAAAFQLDDRLARVIFTEIGGNLARDEIDRHLAGAALDILPVAISVKLHSFTTLRFGLSPPAVRHIQDAPGLLQQQQLLAG